MANASVIRSRWNATASVPPRYGRPVAKVRFRDQRPHHHQWLGYVLAVLVTEDGFL